jgi:hypothetical protein
LVQPKASFSASLALCGTLDALQDDGLIVFEALHLAAISSL